MLRRKTEVLLSSLDIDQYYPFGADVSQQDEEECKERTSVLSIKDTSHS